MAVLKTLASETIKAGLRFVAARSRLVEMEQQPLQITASLPK